MATVSALIECFAAGSREKVVHPWSKPEIGNLFLVTRQMSNVQFFGGPEFSLTL